MPIVIDKKETGRLPNLGVRGALGFLDIGEVERIGGVYRNKRYVPEELEPEWRAKSHYDIPAPMTRSLFEPTKASRPPGFMRDWQSHVETWLEDNEPIPEHWKQMLITERAHRFYRDWMKYEKRLLAIKEGNEQLVEAILGAGGIDNSFWADVGPERYPKPHQKAGLAFFLTCLSIFGTAHFCLYDEMRTGKTKQAIDIARYLIKNQLASGVLVVCPNSIKRVWLYEIQLDAPLLSFLSVIIQGTKPQKKERWESNNFFYIVNYECARADEEYMRAWAERKRQNGGFLLICDESHKLKNPDAKQTRAVLSLRPNYSIFMTGTPIANRPEDAFTTSDFVSPGILGASVEHFKEKFGIRGGYRGKQITGYAGLDIIQYRLARISLRRRRKEIMFDQTLYQTRQGELTGLQKKAYEEMRDMLWTEVFTDTGEWTAIKASNGFTKALRLVQMSDGYASSSPDDITWFSDSDNWKLRELDEFMEEYLDDIGKVVIWSRFVPVIERLVRRYEKYGALKIRGQMGEQATDNMYRFQQDPECRVMVSQIQTSEGRGFQPATFAIMYDKWLSPHLNDQARDRIVGLKNPVPVTIISLVTEESIDERVEYLVQTKREWGAACLGDSSEHEVHVPVMDKNTLLYLLARPEEAGKYKELISK